MNSKPWEMEGDDLAEYLLAGATWQDDLLQAYRSLHLTLQSIFLAIGAGLVVAVLSFSEKLALVLTAISFAAFFLVAGWALIQMRQLILARGEDVNFWHREILKHEGTATNGSRVFLSFKISQKLRRGNIEHLEKLLSGNAVLADADIDILVAKGLGHTRRVIDQWLTAGIGLTWIVLFIIVIVTLYTRLIGPGS